MAGAIEAESGSRTFKVGRCGLAVPAGWRVRGWSVVAAWGRGRWRRGRRHRTLRRQHPRWWHRGGASSVSALGPGFGPWPLGPSLSPRLLLGYTFWQPPPHMESPPKHHPESSCRHMLDSRGRRGAAPRKPRRGAHRSQKPQHKQTETETNTRVRRHASGGRAQARVQRHNPGRCV